MKPKKRTKNIYRHIFQLSKFLSSSVLLQSLDVYTDVTTAISFLKQNHLHWAIATLFFVYLPFIANIATYLYGFISIFIEMWQDKISRQVWKVFLAWRNVRKNSISMSTCGATIYYNLPTRNFLLHLPRRKLFDKVHFHHFSSMTHRLLWNLM